MIFIIFDLNHLFQNGVEKKKKLKNAKPRIRTQSLDAAGPLCYHYNSFALYFIWNKELFHAYT